MPLSATQAVLLATIAASLVIVTVYGGRERWRDYTTDRLLYGLPLGTLFTVAIVLGFYLFAQHGLWHWHEPVVFAYVSWSYFYPTGWLTAGIAHSSPAHLLSNLTGTLALAPIAEYAWSHYPGGDRSDRARSGQDSDSVGDTDDVGSSTGRPSKHGWAATGGDDFDDSDSTGGSDPTGSGGAPAGDGSLTASPWVRALVLFPGALLLSALVTSFFGLGPGIGFSGAVYAIMGFAVVTYPLASVVGVVVASGLGVLYDALTEPVVREVVEPVTPTPPSWAGVGFQAHALGFLLGVIAAVVLLRQRRRRPGFLRVFAVVLTVGLVMSLWLLAWPGGDDVYYLYRGAGVVVLFGLAALVAVAASGSTRATPRPLSILPWAPSRRMLAVAWVVLLAFLALPTLATAVLTSDTSIALGVATVLLALLLALPALPVLLPARIYEGPMSRRNAATFGLVLVAVLIAVPSTFLGIAVVGDGATTSEGSVAAGDYTVFYGDNVTSEQRPGIGLFPDDAFQSEQTGVIVASDDRELWTVGVQERVLEHEGNGTVVLGGPGWHEAVEAQRVGWTVVGNDTAYAVDLRHDGEVTRSYTSEPVTADVRIDGQTVAVVPTPEGFELRVSRDGEAVRSVPVPDVGETATAGNLELATERVDGERRITAASGDSRVVVATEETYPAA